MIDDLKIIKKEYGEKMAHLCRELFPIILETEGLLSKIITSKFARNHFLYDDFKDNNMIEEFKNYIYSLVDVKHKEEKQINKSVKELMSDAGYDFYECQTEEDIQSFRKYYATGEELCTFTNGNRLERCHVFFAVKKNVDEIKRENFKNPERQDEYGTSVISIQFTRNGHTLSIKNRYNHRVNNPDATFSNNLENIIPGLTQAFEEEYNLKINQNESSEFYLSGYVIANDGKFYKYNYEINNIYYCPNNVIIDNGDVEKFDTSRYLVIDYFSIDMQEKSINCEYDIDSFAIINSKIRKIEVINLDNDEKQIIITREYLPNNIGEEFIKTNKYNRIIEYINNNIIELPEYFMWNCQYLKRIELQNVITIKSCALRYATMLNEMDTPKLEYIESLVLVTNLALKRLNLPKLKEIGSYFLRQNSLLEELDTPNLLKIGVNLLWNNIYSLKKVDCSIYLASPVQNKHVADLFCKRIEEKREKENEEIKNSRSK